MHNLSATDFPTVFDTQQAFRLLMDSMARPGKVNHLPNCVSAAPPDLSPFIAVVCFTLLDSETCFHTEDQAWRDYLRVHTGSLPMPAETAEFVIISGEETDFDLSGLNRGTLLFPDRGATLIISVEEIETPAEGLRVNMTGPGVPGFRDVLVKGLSPFCLESIASLNEECPLGVDTILVARDGAMVCLPRFTRMQWEVCS